MGFWWGAGAALLVLGCVLFVRIFLVLRRNEAHKPCKTGPASVLVVLGSGGHTTEILRLMNSLSASYAPRHYVIANTDRMSEEKVRFFEAVRTEENTEPQELTLKDPANPLGKQSHQHQCSRSGQHPQHRSTDHTGPASLGGPHCPRARHKTPKASALLGIPTRQVSPRWAEKTFQGHPQSLLDSATLPLTPGSPWPRIAISGGRASGRASDIYHSPDSS
uniref:UDP-N-acetylglucosamine transferase subunit ALG14 isoform X1 n=1 Tax=Pristiophorus japonicus TaxID=55135 RepID=UPI00398E77DD